MVISISEAWYMTVIFSSEIGYRVNKSCLVFSETQSYHELLVQLVVAVHSDRGELAANNKWDELDRTEKKSRI
jgi:hypothetical protein